MKIAHQKCPGGTIFWWATGALVQLGANMLDEFLAALAPAEVGRDQVEEGLDILARSGEVQFVHAAFVQAPATFLVGEKPHDTVVGGVEPRQKFAGGSVFATASVDTVVHFYVSLWCTVPLYYTPNLYICQ